MTTRLVVVKVGGSLLQWPELPQRLKAWLADQGRSRHVFLAGGGALCDAVRRADQQFSLGETKSHWLCVDLLSVTARILAHALGEMPLVDSLDAKLAGNCVFDPRRFLREEEPQQRGVPLPRTWDATSDSIAARLAECLAADGLVLMKSADPPVCDVQALAECGYVDRHFSVAAAAVARVTYLNLRSGWGQT